MKILVLALSGIGDALMFTPALELTKQHFPQAEIDALVMFKGVEDMYKRIPQFNKVMYFDFMKEGAVNSLKYVLKLRGKYDYSVNVYPSNRKEYNAIQFLIGATERAGIEYIRSNKSNFGFLNTVHLKEKDSLHNVEENILLMKKMLRFTSEEKPGLVFPLTNNDTDSAEMYLQEKGLLNSAPIIGFHPGCATLKNHINRRWEPAKFASLATQLIAQTDAKILLFGGPEEEELKRTIHGEVNSANCFLTNQRNLAESAALIARCDVFITNDSSLMHVASAMKRKVIAIIGPTNTAYIHPWQTDYRIVSLHLECAPCFFYSPKPLICTREDVQFKCIRELDVDMVLAAVKEFL